MAEVTIQYCPKVTIAMKRTSHAGCNACDAHFRRVLHRICYSNVADMKRASWVQHLRGICSGSMWHTREMRTSDAFVVHSCIADVAHFQRVGSARDHGLLLVSTVITTFVYLFKKSGYEYGRCHPWLNRRSNHLELTQSHSHSICYNKQLIQ
jgi:hypothetical protein